MSDRLILNLTPCDIETINQQMFIQLIPERIMCDLQAINQTAANRANQIAEELQQVKAAIVAVALLEVRVSAEEVAT